MFVKINGGRENVTRCPEKTPSPAHQIFLSGNVYMEGPWAQRLLEDSTDP